MKDDGLYLIHMLECVSRIEEYASGGKGAFLTDTKTQDAVMRNLQILAESSQRLSLNLKDRHAGVDWRGIARFRNFAVHAYLGVRWDMVWDIVERDLPQLKTVLTEMRRELDTAADDGTRS